MAWVAFALYGMFAAAAVQFFALTDLFPALNAGHGLLVGGDSVTYHAIAAQAAQAIKIHGWPAWSLAPNGQTAAGLAAPFYALIAPEPWSVIPINAALHATAGLIVMRLLHLLCADIRIALAGAILWTGFPSSLQWVGQIQKDGYYFVGMLGVLLAWVLLVRSASRNESPLKMVEAATLLLVCIGVTGIARLYGLQLIQAASVATAAVAVPLMIVRSIGRRVSVGRCAAIIGVYAMAIVALNFAPRDSRLDTSMPSFGGDTSGARTSAELIALQTWRNQPGVPLAVDVMLLRLNTARLGYVGDTYRSAGSTIDGEARFTNAGEFLAYLPRALQIGFLAPFPAHWIAPAASPGGAIMRRVAGVEMLLLYPLLLLGLPLAAWRWRARVEMWLIVVYCLPLVLVYTYVTPNLGTLYRLRYGFLMTLAALGLAGLWLTIHGRFARKRATPNI